jgi:prepilin-type processing-associated H-X9-DG protein
MADRKRERLLGYLTGALEKTDERRVEEQLEDDRDLREELAEVEAALRPLRRARRQYAPPPGLAARTCQMIALLGLPPGAVVPESAQPHPRERARRMTADAAPPTGAASWNWVDVAVAVCLFVAATVFVVPAMQRSRMNSRTMACQDRLRDVGRGFGSLAQTRPEFTPVLFQPDVQPGHRSAADISIRLASDAASPDRERVLPVNLVNPLSSRHPGFDEPVRGQNVLFADGHASLLATGPYTASGCP